MGQTVWALWMDVGFIWTVLTHPTYLWGSPPTSQRRGRWQAMYGQTSLGIYLPTEPGQASAHTPSPPTPTPLTFPLRLAVARRDTVSLPLALDASDELCMWATTQASTILPLCAAARHSGTTAHHHAAHLRSRHSGQQHYTNIRTGGRYRHAALPTSLWVDS